MPEPLGKYVKDKPGWDRYALTSPDLLDACMDAATRGMAFAESISPTRTGEYRAAFTVAPSTYVSPQYGPRIAAELSNNSAHAASVEFGTDPHTIQPGVEHPGATGRRVLQRTAEFLGSA